MLSSQFKASARQTAQATDTIQSEMQSIQHAASASAVTEIGKAIHGLDDISKTILRSVDEQRSATQQISQNIEQAAIATRNIS